MTILAFASPASIALAQTIDWAVGSGNWNTAANWLPANIPNAPGETARFPVGGGTYTTTLNTSPTLDAVYVLNPTATLNLGTQTLTALLSPGFSNSGVISANAGTATLYGTITNAVAGIFRMPGAGHLDLYGPTVLNAGQFLVNSNGSESNADMTIDQSTEFSGPGEIVLLSTSSAEDAIIYTGTGAILTNAVDHTIRGTGSIYGGLANYGRVAGGGTGYGLTLGSTSKTNHGVMETLSGGLLIVSTGIDQSANGIIRAANGTVRLITGAEITGGTLAASGGGTIVCTANTPYLVDVVNLAPLDIQGGVNVNAGGSILTNNGVLRINSSNNSSNASLNLGNAITLQGGGEILLQIVGDLGDASINAASTNWSSHAAGHTIHGAGTVSASMTNQGTIRGDTSAKRLYLSMPWLVNEGLLAATSGGILDFVCDSVMQSAGGRILADEGTVRLTTPASITGGRIETNAGGQIQSYSGIVSVTDVHNLGDWRLKPGTTTDLWGAVVRNDGTITVNETSPGNTNLRAREPVVLSGTGAVVLQCSSSADDASFTGGTGVTFTHGTDHTIRGVGLLSAGMINEGTVLADLGGVGLVVSGADKTNRNLFRAGPGGKMTIESTTITQEGPGRIVADDGQVFLSGATVQGGVLQTTGSGYLRSFLTSNLRNVTNVGELRIAPGCVLEIVGDSLRNDGVVRINDTGADGDCYMEAQQNMTLAGSGEVVLRTGGAYSDATVATVAGATLTVAPGQEIHGEGQISANLINLGTITGDVPGRSLNLVTNGQTNEATMRAVGGGLFRVTSGTVVNHALIEAADTSRVSIYGGTLDNQANVVARDGSTFQVEAGTFENRNLARAHSGGRIYQTNGTINNHGTLRAEAQGEIRIDQTIAFRNYGIVEATDAGLFWGDRWADHFSGSTLSGGSWRAIGTGQLRMIGVNVQTLDAEIVMEGPNARIWSDEGITDALAGMTAIGSAGAFEIRGGRNYSRGGNLASAGQIRVGAGTDLTVTGRLRQTIDAAVCAVEGTLTSPDTLRFDRGFVRGNGRIIGNVHNQGTVQPGASVGHLTIQGAFKQRTHAVVAFELGGTASGASDLLEITGSADLGGMISLRTTNGYQPHEGDTIEIMRFASRTGNFTQFDICPAPGVCAELLWSATSLRVILHVLPTSDVQEPDTPQEPQEPEIGEPIADDSPALPAEFELKAIGSVAGGARIELALPEASDGQVTVFDVTGRRVVVLDRGPWSPGTHSYSWCGEAENGERVSRGVYFAKAWVQTEEGTHIRRARFVLLK